MFFPVSEWLTAFVLTLLVEVPVVVVLLRRWSGEGVPRLLALAVLANLATHPSVWFVFTQLLLVGTPAYTLVVEAWAFGVEALFYAVVVAGLGWRRALVVSLVANLASWVVGRLVLVPLIGLVT